VGTCPLRSRALHPRWLSNRKNASVENEVASCLPKAIALKKCITAKLMELIESTANRILSEIGWCHDALLLLTQKIIDLWRPLVASAASQGETVCRFL
jgi:hypothetical protein